MKSKARKVTWIMQREDLLRSSFLKVVVRGLSM